MAEKIVVGIEKVTWMKLTTKPLDNKNFEKVRKAFCACPQIKDQVYDDKCNTTVTIKVVCCSPEDVMDRLCKKGAGAIRRIETFDPSKPTTEKPKAPEKPKEAEKPKEPVKPNPAPAAAPGSQPMVYPGYVYPGYVYPGYPVSSVDSNGPQYAWNQQNGYRERPVYDSYGGGPPPSYYGEEDSVCAIM